MKKEIGRQGEDLAASFLEARGYRIEQRNYRCRWGEIDLICCKNNILVFVEVRSKKDTSFGTPEESITRNKINKIHKTAFDYLQNLKGSTRQIRFDFIGIIGTGDDITINHIEGAF
ncbi:MAG: YraN family protein [Chitinophagales bacterium]